MFLNSDTIVPEGALRTMVDIMERNPYLGVLAPRLVNGDGRLSMEECDWACGACLMVRERQSTGSVGVRSAPVTIWIPEIRFAKRAARSG